MFFEHGQEEADRLFLVSDRGEMVTYGKADSWCLTMGEQLVPRSLLFIDCKNTVGAVLGYVACLRKRVVPVLLDAKLAGEARQKLIDLYEPDYLYTPCEDAEASGKTGEILWEDYDYRLIKRESKRHESLHQELALLLTTSGSTGSPKLVRQSYQNIQTNAEAIASYLELDAAQRPITTLPMHYTYGLSIIHSHLLCKSTILLTEHTVFEKEFWDFFRREKATSFGGVPFTYEMLKRIGFLHMDLPSLETMTQAGGKLSRQLQKAFTDYARSNGKKFIVMYGQTEATARMSYLPMDKALEKIGSIGIPIPGGRFTIAEGELVYEGPNVTMGYALSGADLSKGDERHGVLYTGDLAYADEDGYYYIVGRKKRFLKLLGSRVNLDEVEQLIQSGYDGLRAACAGKDDALVIYIENQENVKEDALLDYLGEKLHMNTGLMCIRRIERIPVSSSGKTLYQELDKL